MDPTAAVVLLGVAARSRHTSRPSNSPQWSPTAACPGPSATLTPSAMSSVSPTGAHAADTRIRSTVERRGRPIAHSPGGDHTDPAAGRRASPAATGPTANAGIPQPADTYNSSNFDRPNRWAPGVSRPKPQLKHASTYAGSSRCEPRSHAGTISSRTVYQSANGRQDSGYRRSRSSSCSASSHFARWDGATPALWRPQPATSPHSPQRGPQPANRTPPIMPASILLRLGTLVEA